MVKTASLAKMSKKALKVWKAGLAETDIVVKIAKRTEKTKRPN